MGDVDQYTILQLLVVTTVTGTWSLFQPHLMFGFYIFLPVLCADDHKKYKQNSAKCMNKLSFLQHTPFLHTFLKIA